MHDLTQLKKVQDYLSKDSRELYLQAGKALGVNAMLLQDNSGLHLFTIATSNRILSILGLVVTTINEIQPNKPNSMLIEYLSLSLFMFNNFLSSY